VSDEETARRAEAQNLHIQPEEWQRMSDRLSERLAPGLLSITEAAQRFIEPMLEAQRAFRVRAALLSPLAQILPISASQRERQDGTTALNRHMVLHGESLDYGTKANSLKAISLINYVTQILGNELSGNDRKEVADS